MARLKRAAVQAAIKVIQPQQAEPQNLGESPLPLPDVRESSLPLPDVREPTLPLRERGSDLFEGGGLVGALKRQAQKEFDFLSGGVRSVVDTAVGVGDYAVDTVTALPRRLTQLTRNTDDLLFGKDAYWRQGQEEELKSRRQELEERRRRRDVRQKLMDDLRMKLEGNPPTSPRE